MEALKKPKIEAILPLTYMQQGFLFHHLSSNDDQGFLAVECGLTGVLDIALFETAWNRTIDRHGVLRTTVHWNGLEKPVALTHQERKVKLEYLDWSQFSFDVKREKWKELKTATTARGINFENDPLLSVILADFGEKGYRMLWPCHHLLIDGWSSQVVLDDFLTIYNALVEKKNMTLTPLLSLRAYYKWLDGKDNEQASEFWTSYFEDFEQPPLFGNTVGPTAFENPLTAEIELSETETNGLKAIARDTKVTLNTLVQGAWSFLLSRYFGVDEVVHGTTLSGRSGDFPNMNRLAGMFMNVQPVRGLFHDTGDTVQWFRDFQGKQQRANAFEYVNLDEIMALVDWPEAKPLFDSLVIFENFPQAVSDNRVLKLQDFKSGITSTYPLTMVVIPERQMKFTLFLKTGSVDKKAFDWIVKTWERLVGLLLSGNGTSFDRLRSEIPVFRNDGRSRKDTSHHSQIKNKYAAPRNGTELQLVRIWESLFGIHSIGMNDDFFAMGGKSLLAARVFAIINKQMGVQLPPTTLLEHPTIASIARLIDTEGDTRTPIFENLVPIRAKGDRPALFCIHAGGGHVFFYNLLAKYLDGNRPIYAMQPSGIYGNERMHKTIIEMAGAYVDEIRRVQPKGPYNLMVYCFSTAVGLEMSKLLKSEGTETNLIIMDTMAEQEHLMTKTRVAMRVSGFFKRFLKNPINVLNIMFTDRYTRYVKPLWVRLTGTAEEKNAERMSGHLTKIYNRYKWQSQKAKVKLVLTEKADSRFNKEYIRSWEEIALNGVEVIETVGDHRTLFEEPDVQKVAKTIEDCLL